MEADPNMNFGSFSHYNNHQVPSFSWQYNDSSGFDGIGNPVSMSGNADAAPGISFVMPPGSSPANMALSPARRLVHGPAWSIKWTPHEQAILNRGLEEYVDLLFILHSPLSFKNGTVPFFSCHSDFLFSHVPDRSVFVFFAYFSDLRMILLLQSMLR